MTSWQEIRARIVRRITDRVWRPGDRLPAEVELAAEFGCSRSTVNRAMREIAKSGLISRRRKAGTVVARHPVHKTTLDIPVTRRQIEERGLVYSHLLLTRVVQKIPTFVAGRLGAGPDIRMLYLRTLQFGSGQPWLLEDRWIDIDTVPEAVDVDFTSISANEWLVQNAPLTRAVMSIGAVTAGTEAAELLATDPGAALLSVKRETWQHERAVTHVHLLHAPGHVVETSF